LKYKKLNGLWYIYIIIVWTLVLGILGFSVTIGGTDETGYFNGTIDEVIIMGRAISADEAKALYSAKENSLTYDTGNLSEGNYTFKAMAIEKSGIYNETEERKISIVSYSLGLPEILSVDIDPDEPRVTDELSCTVILEDIDSEMLNVTFIWFVNDTYDDSWNTTVECNLSKSSSCVSDTDVTTPLFNKTYVCSAQATDAVNTTDWRNSSEVLVVNSKPTITLVSPLSGNDTTNRTPTLIWEGNDADGDSLTYEVNITCFPSCSDDNRNIGGIISENYTLSEVVRYLYDGLVGFEDNYFYNWTVRAYDGIEYSDPVTAWNFTVKSLLDIVLNPDSIDFGEWLPGNITTTVDDDPQPLIIYNNGNTYVNISFRAENYIWDSVQEISNHSRIKVDSVSGINDAYDASSSVTNWMNINRSENVTIIADLNYSTIKNQAEIDFNLTVPDAEPAGDKAANYTLFAKVSIW
jgi:hypothetical protein